MVTDRAAVDLCKCIQNGVKIDNLWRSERGAQIIEPVISRVAVVTPLQNTILAALSLHYNRAGSKNLNNGDLTVTTPRMGSR